MLQCYDLPCTVNERLDRTLTTTMPSHHFSKQETGVHLMLGATA